jgi:hypothetical protein
MAESAFAGTVQQLKREIAALESQLSRARNALRLLGGDEGGKSVEVSPKTPRTGLEVMTKVLEGVNLSLQGVVVTDALVKVVRQTPGMTRRQVLDAAVPLMETTSKNPRKTAAARLGQLLKTKGRIVMREGKVYPVG